MAWVPDIGLVVAGALLGAFLFWLVISQGGSKRPPVEYTPDERKVFEATKKIGPALVVAAIVGILALALWAASEGLSEFSWSWALFTQRLGLYLLVAAAAAAVGGVGGFLFGIPRAREISETVAQQGHDPTKTRRAVLAANTNLERVSDWLTTLLVGATLVQIKPITEWVGELGPKLKDDPAGAVTPVTVVFFLAIGFLGVYLMTRLYLTYALQLMLKLGLEGEEAPPSPDQLKSDMSEALAGTDLAKQRAAFASFVQQKTQPDVANDAAANLAAARLAARIFKATSDANEKQAAAAGVQEALAKAVPTPAAKAALKQNADHLKDFQNLNDEGLQGQVDALLNTEPQVPPPGPGPLKSDMSEALAGTDLAKQRAAFASFVQQKTQPDVANDAAANLAAARLAARIFKAATDPTEKQSAAASLRETLPKGVPTAGAKAAVKADDNQLKDFQNLGDANLQGEVDALLNGVQ
jgi:hypothetical protein